MLLLQNSLCEIGRLNFTAELFHKVAKAYGKKSRLFPFPVWLLRLGAKLAGKQAMADRLLGSLQVDSSKARVVGLEASYYDG